MPFPRDTGQTRKGGRYDRKHQIARADAAKHHDPNHGCARCGHPLGPMGPWLHYDHDETGGYLGFSHGQHPCPDCGQRCNVRAGAQKGRSLQGSVNHPPRTVRRRFLLS